MMQQLMRVAGIAGTVFLAGCVSVIPSPQMPDALYSIKAAQTPYPVASNLTIREPESPLIVSGQAMTSKAPGGEIRLLPGAEWAERSTRLIQLAAIDSFQVGEDGAALLPESGVKSSYELTSRLQTLELQSDRAVCEISVALVDLQSREMLAHTVVRAEQTAPSSKTLDRAATLKSATEACVDQMAKFASTAVAANTQP